MSKNELPSGDITIEIKGERRIGKSTIAALISKLLKTKYSHVFLEDKVMERSIEREDFMTFHNRLDDNFSRVRKIEIKTSDVGEKENDPQTEILRLRKMVADAYAEGNSDGWASKTTKGGGNWESSVSKRLLDE